MLSDIKRDIPKFGIVFTQSGVTEKLLRQNSNSHKGVELWAKSINDFGNFGRYFPCATFAKILAAMYARVQQAMAQFVLKIEQLSHIINPNTRNGARLRSPSLIIASVMVMSYTFKVWILKEQWERIKN